MADKLLLIPGTSGCKLLADGVDIGWPGALTAGAFICGTDSLAALAAKLGLTAAAIVARLSMEFADDGSFAPTKTTLTAQSAIAPGAVIAAAYNQLQDAEVFAYDWRSDLRHNAARLLAHLETHKPSGRWRIAAHSQGGLLVPIAARMLGTRGGGQDARAFSRLVSHVGLCGVPLYGTPRAADALANGENLSGGFSGSFLQIVRTWPAIYQMLPSWKGALAGAHCVSLRLLDDAAWAGVPIDLRLLARARATRAEYLRRPLAFLSGVKVRILMSRAHATPNAMFKSGSTMTLAGSEPGDELVPYRTTRDAMNDVERQASYGFGGRQDTAVHFMLMNDPAIASDLRGFLRS